MPQLALVAGYVIVVFVGLLGLLIVWRVFKNDINLSMLVSEKDPMSDASGKAPQSIASMSRFQFLIFTFVVAVCILVLTLESGEFPHLEPNVLALLGISGGSYLISKGIQQSNRKDGESK